TAASAVEAWALLMEAGENRPDVVISDIGMPDEDGYTLIRKIRSGAYNRRQVPAIAVTAYARMEDRVKALAAGFQEHGGKPVDPEKLIAVVAGLTGWGLNR